MSKGKGLTTADLLLGFTAGLPSLHLILDKKTPATWEGVLFAYFLELQIRTDGQAAPSIDVQLGIHIRCQVILRADQIIQAANRWRCHIVAPWAATACIAKTDAEAGERMDLIVEFQRAIEVVISTAVEHVVRPRIVGVAKTISLRIVVPAKANLHWFVVHFVRDAEIAV